MTRLEAFESGLGIVLVRLGIVPVEWLVKYNTYKCYLEFSTSHSPSKAKKLTAEKCDCDISTVKRHIAEFEKGNHVEELDIKKSGRRWISGDKYWKKWPSQS